MEMCRVWLGWTKRPSNQFFQDLWSVSMQIATSFQISSTAWFLWASPWGQGMWTGTSEVVGSLGLWYIRRTTRKWCPFWILSGGVQQESKDSWRGQWVKAHRTSFCFFLLSSCSLGSRQECEGVSGITEKNIEVGQRSPDLKGRIQTQFNPFRNSESNLPPPGPVWGVPGKQDAK